MKTLFLGFIFLSVTLFASTAFEDAYKIYKANDFKKSLTLFTKLADNEKDYDAAYILGYMYEHGEGCKVDIAKSQYYYKLSSHGYYWQSKPDPSRDFQKERRKLYNTISKPEDKTTLNTIKQVTESLYSIKAYGANYFLPISYLVNGLYGDTYEHTAQKVETEFQVSIKYDFATNFLGLGEVYSIGYTQKSFWQLYAYSAYFRESNYNPEAFVTLPIQEFKSFNYLKVVRLAYGHQSNGRGGDQERSWDYLYGSFYFQTGFLFTKIQLWNKVGSLKYNPDLMDYMGYGSLEFILPYKKHLFKIMSRNILSDKRAIEVNYSYPMFGSKDLFFYLKAFSGYGESLVDYNNNINKVGIGFSLSR